MQKSIRDYKTSQKINRIEVEWWDKNADIIKRLWEMDWEISSKIRNNYLNNVKKFFINDDNKKVILELGCGSGWVGQMLANQKFHIIGTDFSKNQIILAKKNAKKRKLDKYTKYCVLDSKHWPKEKKIDGILIHAFLHHLDNQEIKELFMELKKRFKNGTKIWIYEPTFYRKKIKAQSIKINLITKILSIISFKTVIFLEKIYHRTNLLDNKEFKKFIKLQEIAAKNKWYLSPKEIPFDLDEFNQELKKYFKVTNHYWATIYLIGWTAKINLVKNRIVKRIITILLLPLLILADKKVCNEGNYLRKKIVCPNYAFHVWEGEIE